MKTIGLIGGMSWLTTSHYYTKINEGINQKLGNNHSAKCLIHSLDFAEIEQLQKADKWNQISDIIIDSSRKLISCGAELIALCSNTIHIIADDIQEKIGIPIINIIDATGEEIRKTNIRKIGLLGTKFTMGKKFYIDTLEKKYHIEVNIPNKKDMEIINSIIFDELAKGIFKQESKNELNSIIYKFDTEAVVLACTELPLIIKHTDMDKHVFDTMKIHIDKIIDTALE